MHFLIKCIVVVLEEVEVQSVVSNGSCVPEITFSPTLIFHKYVKCIRLGFKRKPAKAIWKHAKWVRIALKP